MPVNWFTRPPSMLASRAARAEDTNTSVSDLDDIINILLTAFNAFDNTCPTLNSIVWRFGAEQTVPLMSEHLIFFGPFGLICAGGYLAVELYNRYRKRNALDAHWEREKYQLSELHEKLKECPQDDAVDTSREILFKKIAFIIVECEKKLDFWRKVFEKNLEVQKKKEEKNLEVQKEKEEKNKEMLTKIEEVQAKIEALKAFYAANEKLKALLDEANREFEASKNISEATLTNDQEREQPTAKPSLPVSPAQKNLLEEAKANKEAITDELNNNFLTRFSGTSWFQVPFAWAWGYWFVFFFTMWGIATPFAAVPLTWGLLALTGPVLYLIYREYRAYQFRLAMDESQLSEEEQTALSEIENPENSGKQEKRKEILKTKEENTTQFRWNWLFVALITAVSVSLFCGFAPIYAVLLGIAVFTGVGLSAFGIGKLIDWQLKKQRAALKNQEKELLDDFTLEVFTTEKVENFNLAEPKNTNKRIILIGTGWNKTAYFADEGKFLLDKDGKPRKVRIKLAAFFSENEKNELEKLNQYGSTSIPDKTKNLIRRVARLALVNNGYLSEMSSREQAIKNKHNLRKAQVIAEYSLKKLATLREQIKKDVAILELTQQSQSALFNAMENPIIEEKKGDKNVSLSLSQWKQNLDDECQSLENKDVNGLLNDSITHPRLEKYRPYLVAFIGFVSGYTLGCIVGFPTTDFLGHLPGLSSVISDGMVTPILIGAFSLVVAVSHMDRKKLEDEKHRGELQEKRANPEYLLKQHRLNELNKKIAALRESINSTMGDIKNTVYVNNSEAGEKYKNEIDALINRSSQKSTIEKFKKRALFVARAIFKILTDVGSVILIARALVTMGFSRALLPIFFASSTAVMAPLTTGVFSMFGAAFSMNPFGITILTIAILLLLTKAVVELYMVAQREKELAKIDKIDLTLEKTLAELEHLSRVDSVLKAEKEASINLKAGAEKNKKGTGTEDKGVEVGVEVEAGVEAANLAILSQNSSLPSLVPVATFNKGSNPVLLLGDNDRANEDSIKLGLGSSY